MAHSRESASALKKALGLITTLHVVLFISLALTAQGCDDTDAMLKTCQQTGLCDTEAPPPEEIHVLCDGSLGSTCTKETLDATLDVVLPYAAHRPGSVVSLWGLGTDYDDTTVLASTTSTAPPSRSKRARTSHESRWTAMAKLELEKNAEPYLDRKSRRLTSPIAEGLTKIGQARTHPDQPTWIVVVSDGRQMTRLANFECRSAGFPTNNEVWLKTLTEAGVLTAGSLQGNLTVVFTYQNSAPINGSRCAVEVSARRTNRIRELWTVALSHAGATVLPFSVGTAQLESESTPVTSSL